MNSVETGQGDELKVKVAFQFILKLKYAIQKQRKKQERIINSIYVRYADFCFYWTTNVILTYPISPFLAFVTV